MARRKPKRFLPRNASVLSLRDTLDFPIPRCSECEQQMVKLHGRWACPEHSTVITDLKPDPATGSIVPVTLPIGEVYLNRRMRRRA